MKFIPYHSADGRDSEEKARRTNNQYKRRHMRPQRQIQQSVLCTIILITALYQYAFFATVKLPLLLHCVRCHANYTEVENGSLLPMPHDNNSAEVEWVSCSTHYMRRTGVAVERLLSEGDLDLPDRWCYEASTLVSRSCLCLFLNTSPLPCTVQMETAGRPNPSDPWLVTCGLP
jgi:hypothetical protein